LVRIFGPIVLPESLFMSAGQLEILKCGGVGPQLVGHTSLGMKPCSLSSLRMSFRAPALNQLVEDLPLLIDGAPEIHPLTHDPHDHFIKMPSVTRAPGGRL
jgi:hypothetical protein